MKDKEGKTEHAKIRVISYPNSGRTWLRALPDFVVIGSHKCGSSSLYYYLSQHPQILPAAVKEVHFFDGNFEKGPLYYRAYFPLRSEIDDRKKQLAKTVITGEATPNYLFFPHVPRRMAQVVPEAKLIVLLRDPVHRAFSHYMHNRRSKHRKTDREPLSFEEAIAQESERLRGERERMLAEESYYSNAYRFYAYCQRGIYVEQLQEYGKFFDRSRIFVLKSEDFFNNTAEAYGRVLKFLGLDPHVPADLHAKNTGRYSKEERDSDGRLQNVLAQLRDFFKPHNQRLYDYLQRDLGW